MKLPHILLIYTGGTIGSFQDHGSGSLKPVDFERLREFIPELRKLEIDITVKAFPEPLDSSNIQPQHWVKITEMIEEAYDDFDGFVILHGTDTMSYTASALSFMIEGLNKPVILTGSQLPIGMIRTDGKENLVTALEIAARRNEKNEPMVPEVCIYFEFKLYRGNRTFKFSAEHFHAYQSPNYPLLAEAGVDIRFNTAAILPYKNGRPRFHKKLDTNIFIVHLFPGISRQSLENVLEIPGLRAIIAESYGFGNGPLDPWFIEFWQKVTARGIILLNITQCPQGRVIQGKYETSRAFVLAHAVSGADMTLEAALTKLICLMGEHTEKAEIITALETSRAGEMTVD